MELLTMIKLYHWKTHSFSQHKATDELYAKLNENIDTFVEILLGKSNQRVNMLENKMTMYDLEDKTELREHIFEYRQFLIDMNNTFSSKRDSDLLNVRDEILGDLNQFLYLLTFDQP
jgi:DNA-binding ferritin-like protein